VLILTRYADQTIHIGNDVTLMVTEIGQSKGRKFVKFGIEAPREIRVLRGELLHGDGSTGGREPAGITGSNERVGSEAPAGLPGGATAPDIARAGGE
jgi:carbon storage regulator CsrA